MQAQNPLVQTYSYYRTVHNTTYYRVYQNEYRLNFDGNGSRVRAIDYEPAWTAAYGYTHTDEVWIWTNKGGKKYLDYSLKYSGWQEGRTPLPNIRKTVPNESQPALFNLAGRKIWFDETGGSHFEEARSTYHYEGNLYKPTDNLFYGVKLYDTDQSVYMFREAYGGPVTYDLYLPSDLTDLWQIVNYYSCYLGME